MTSKICRIDFKPLILVLNSRESVIPGIVYCGHWSQLFKFTETVTLNIIPVYNLPDAAAILSCVTSYEPDTAAASKINSNGEDEPKRK